MNNVKKLVLPALILACLSAPLFALDIYGEDSVAGGPVQSCGIFAKVSVPHAFLFLGKVFRHNTEGYHFICSATVIDKNTALSAAHCEEALRENPDKVYMLCGSSPKAYRVTTLSPSAEYAVAADNPQKGADFDFGDDLMLVYVDGSYENARAFRKAARSKREDAREGFTPGGFGVAPVAKAPAGFLEIPAEAADCYIAGWGRDEGMYSGDSGAPRSAPIKKLEHDADYPDGSVLKFGFEKSFIGSGDSGGSLICRKDGVDHLVGVNVGGRVVGQSVGEDPNAIPYGYAANVMGRI